MAPSWNIVQRGLIALLTLALAQALQAQTYTVLHEFEPKGPGGAIPASGVIRDADGNLYGGTGEGGANDAGVLYKLDRAGKQTILRTFTGGATGQFPYGLVRDRAGNLYGLALGGSTGNGLVFKFDTAGNYTVLYTFTGGADGGNPAGLTLDESGNLYGTTTDGGAPCFSFGYTCGVVFKLDPAGNETVLHTFLGGTADGAAPRAGVIRDDAGNLYGTTQDGGALYLGTVFNLDPAGNETILHNFQADDTGDGNGPIWPLVRDKAGNLHGMACAAVPGALIFKLDPAGNETILYRLPTLPNAMIMDEAGNLYATMQSGGAGGEGILFELDTTGNFTVLHSFSFAGGFAPVGSVVRDPAGRIFGTTMAGGKRCRKLTRNQGCGVVFEFSPSGSREK